MADIASRMDTVRNNLMALMYRDSLNEFPCVWYDLPVVKMCARALKEVESITEGVVEVPEAFKSSYEVLKLQAHALLDMSIMYHVHGCPILDTLSKFEALATSVKECVGNVPLYRLEIAFWSFNVLKVATMKYDREDGEAGKALAGRAEGICREFTSIFVDPDFANVAMYTSVARYVDTWAQVEIMAASSHLLDTPMAETLAPAKALAISLYENMEMEKSEAVESRLLYAIVVLHCIGIDGNEDRMDHARRWAKKWKSAKTDVSSPFGDIVCYASGWFDSSMAPLIFKD